MNSKQEQWQPLSAQWVAMAERNLPDPPIGNPIPKAEALALKWEHVSHVDLEKGGFANISHCKKVGLWRIIVRWSRRGLEWKHLGIKAHGELVDQGTTTVQRLIEIGAVIE